jgi:hypothetical protein
VTPTPSPSASHRRTSACTHRRRVGLVCSAARAPDSIRGCRKAKWLTYQARTKS